MFDNTNDSFYYLSAVLSIQRKKYKKALDEINYAIKLNADIYYYYLVKSDIYHLINKDDKKIENIKKAYELMPKAGLYYKYKCEKNNLNKNYFIPDFYREGCINEYQ